MNIIIGDILHSNTTPKEVLVCHQVNCKGIMGAGLAKQIRNKYPQVYYVYKNACNIAAQENNTSKLLGTFQIIDVSRNSGYKVVNIFGQDGYGRDRQYTSYEALTKAFKELCHLMRNEVVRIPYGIGCGLGGGDWSVVEQIIEKELVFHGREVEVWKLK